MSFSHWCRVVFTSRPPDPILNAQMDNLVREDRIVEMDDFRRKLGDRFTTDGGDTLARARDVLDHSRAGLRDMDCVLLGLLPSKSAGHRSYKAVTFFTAAQLARDPARDVDLSKLPPRVRLSTPLFAESPRRFLWTTFDEEVDGLSPTRVAISLGLPHFTPRQAVYKVSLGEWPDTTYIPTCMDSGIFEAWMRPPAGHTNPWGMTRDLLFGSSLKPELLVEVAQVEGRELWAERVGPDDAFVGNYTPDLLIGRDLAGCVA